MITKLAAMPVPVKTVSLAAYGAAFETMVTVVMAVALALSYRTLAAEDR